MGWQFTARAIRRRPPRRSIRSVVTLMAILGPSSVMAQAPHCRTPPPPCRTPGTTPSPITLSHCSDLTNISSQMQAGRTYRVIVDNCPINLIRITQPNVVFKGDPEVTFVPVNGNSDGFEIAANGVALQNITLADNNGTLFNEGIRVISNVRDITIENVTVAGTEVAGITLQSTGINVCVKDTTARNASSGNGYFVRRTTGGNGTIDFRNATADGNGSDGFAIEHPANSTDQLTRVTFLRAIAGNLVLRMAMALEARPTTLVRSNWFRRHPFRLQHAQRHRSLREHRPKRKRPRPRRCSVRARRARPRVSVTATAAELSPSTSSSMVSTTYSAVFSLRVSPASMLMAMERLWSMSSCSR